MDNSYDNILREAYRDYVSNFVGYDDVPSIFWFEDNAKTNPVFRSKWGIKINEKSENNNHIISIEYRGKKSKKWKR